MSSIARGSHTPTSAIRRRRGCSKVSMSMLLAIVCFFSSTAASLSVSASPSPVHRTHASHSTRPTRTTDLSIVADPSSSSQSTRRQRPWLSPRVFSSYICDVIQIAIPTTSASAATVQRRKKLHEPNHRNPKHRAVEQHQQHQHQHAQTPEAWSTIVDDTPPCPRTAAWAERYTSVDSLRATFGANTNRFWGDLDAASTRRLYKTLLPKALLPLVNAGVYEPQQLAPLAYRARVAAKLYARERSIVPVRAAAHCFDGWRQFSKYGRLGTTYEQIWDKYRTVILAECHEQYRYQQQLEQTFWNSKNRERKMGGRRRRRWRGRSSSSALEYWGFTEEDIKARICLKILERSCSTNELVDAWVLNDGDNDDDVHLASISAQLEDDVRRLLLPPTSRRQRQRLERELNWNTSLQQHHHDDEEEEPVLSRQRYRTLRMVARARRRRAAARKQKRMSPSMVEYIPTVDSETDDDDDDEFDHRLGGFVRRFFLKER